MRKFGNWTKTKHQIDYIVSDHYHRRRRGLGRACGGADGTLINDPNTSSSRVKQFIKRYLAQPKLTRRFNQPAIGAYANSVASSPKLLLTKHQGQVVDVIQLKMASDCLSRIKIRCIFLFGSQESKFT